MLSIESSKVDSKNLGLLYRWFVKEWQNVDAFVDVIDGVILPAPILAKESGELIGGLSFTGYNHALWINALFVIPEKRGLGIACKLIVKAEESARSEGNEELFVCTGFPALYEKLKWEILNYTCDGAVLTKSLG